jgi:tetrahydromethanopterin S-methyltransferase subunit G
MERTVWTDERLNDAIARIEQRFDAVDRRFDAVDRRLERMDQNFDRVWSEFATTHRLIAQIGWGIVAALLVQAVAALIAAAVAFG